MRRNDTATPHLRPITAQQMLDAGLDVRANLAMRVQRTPSQVLGMWMENLGAGVGIGAIPAVVLVFAGAPVDTWTGAWLVVGACTGGWLMWRRGSIDEAAMRKSERMIDRAFRTQAADYEAQIAQAQAEHAADLAEWRRREGVYLDDIDAAAKEIEQLQRGLDQMTRLRDNAIYDLAREREAASMRRGGGPAYVAPTAATPQEVADGTEIIRHRYVRGEHLSRRRACDKAGPHRWSESRWDAARQELERAEVLRIVGGVPEYPPTLEAALAQWGDYLLRARSLSAPAVNRAVGVELYVESETE